jgi:hypothetical protein
MEFFSKFVVLFDHDEDGVPERGPVFFVRVLA